VRGVFGDRNEYLVRDVAAGWVAPVKQRFGAGDSSRFAGRGSLAELTALLGTNCTIDNHLGHQLLPLLGGQRDRETLGSDLGVERAAIDGTITGLARQGLLLS
jgi:hypothetical protein